MIQFGVKYVQMLRILRAEIESQEELDIAMAKLQQQRIKDEIMDTVILVQHPEIVTLGPKAQRDGALDDPAISDYPTRVVDRGGGMTYHGPGQLVVYPIIKWQVGEQSVRNIINRLEDWVMAALADCGIEGYRDDRMMGVWLEGYKVCSIGLAFKHWVSRHGLALNYNTNPNRVESLSCCGLPAGMTTSLQALGHTHDLEGRILDRVRLEKALLVLAEQYLDRMPTEPEDWAVELVA
ncbi:MAG: lipoyl(octanoyl) transferase [Euryarchaeota archaeon]|nr:lipoyl(octanoyl) transferase [Euryarchaeota archaeon]